MGELVRIAGTIFLFLAVNSAKAEKSQPPGSPERATDDLLQKFADLEKSLKYLEHKMLSIIPAVGSIIPWLPSGPSQDAAPIDLPTGWQLCDGSTIEDPNSPFNGLNTPNINGEELFLRGGSFQQSTVVQNDTIRIHNHNINSAMYNRKDTDEDAYTDGDSNEIDLKIEGGCFETQSTYCTSTSAFVGYSTPSVDVDAATVSIHSSNSGVKVNNYGSTETRPKNMAVVYILRIF